MSRERCVERAVRLAVCVAASSIAACTSGADGASFGDPERRSNVQLDRAFVIVLENHSRPSVIGDPNAPFITSLAAMYGNATNYFGVTHPSEPNYVALISGSNWWTNDDSPDNRFDHDNVADELEAKHMTWRGYMEALPALDPKADFWPAADNTLYVSKHNPFVLFNSIRNDPERLAHVRPYTDLATDLDGAHPPDFAFISPDVCNDMHGGVKTAVPDHPETPCPTGTGNDDADDASLKQKADAFVRGAVQTIMGSRAWTGHSAIFLIADEGDFNEDATNGGWASPAGCCDSPVVPAGAPQVSPMWPGGVYGGDRVPAIVIAPAGPHPFESALNYNHYSLLRTLEDAWGLRELAYTADHSAVTTMNEFLTTAK